MFGNKYLCEVIFTQETKRELRNNKMNKYKIVTNNETSMNINFKPDINKLITKERRQFSKYCN
jgi:hypothetical protein